MYILFLISIVLMLSSLLLVDLCKKSAYFLIPLFLGITGYVAAMLWFTMAM